MTNHPDDARLGDYADGTLPDHEAAAVDAHLSVCGACRRRVDRIRELMGELRAFPRGIAPMRDLRPPVPPAGRRPSWAPASIQPWLRAAAGIAVLVGAAAALLWVLPQGPGDSPAVVAEGRAPDGPRAATPALIEPYAEASRDLLTAYRARQAKLTPEAVRLVQRNLAVVDAAIVELESARAEAPSDADIDRLLEDRYRTKVELLRGALALLSEA